ncbi:MAG TPA: PVC-type heme-binding CxxCH protein, partial [Pirellulaceae bacterium]|nr:PVC-type heme-binding CxxCH protein [Pirellulaceae bacterium]
CVNPHLFHMIQGGHYEPWRNRPSSQYAYQRIPTIADHLHYPGKAWEKSRGGTPETLAMGGGHAHCGTLVYLGDQFPEQYRNTVFMCNVHGKRINNDLLERQGSGYVARHGLDFALSADPWFMGVTLKTGPGGSLYVSDWSDTGECHTYKPNRKSGRIFNISYGAAKPTAPLDLSKLSDAELVARQLHRNDWHVQHARRLLQERAAQRDWQGAAVHAELRKHLASDISAPQRLRVLWALHVTGGLDAAALTELLNDKNEYVRAWAIQLLCETEVPAAVVQAKFVTLAEQDPSPVVRLALASALQRLPLADRWAIVNPLIGHEADATDANLPLMLWYAIEPLVKGDKARALQLIGQSKLPLVRQFIARRAVEK